MKMKSYLPYKSKVKIETYNFMYVPEIPPSRRSRKHNFSQEYLDYDISRQIEIESYGYRFLRLKKFNLRLEQAGETKTDVLDRFLRKAFDADE